MINIHDCEWYSNPSIDSRMFLDMNGTKYRMVDDVNDADITIGWCDRDVPHVILNIWHNFENQGHTENWQHWLQDPNVYVVTNVVDDYAVDSGRVFCLDFLFNRTKSYYDNFQFGPDTKKWYHIDRACYSQCDLDQVKLASRVFVSPMRLYMHLKNRTVTYRRWLYHHLLNYTDRGFLSTGTLLSHLDLAEHHAIDDVLNHAAPAIFAPPGYTPPHNAYYRDSFISIYPETIEYGSSIVVTEKTWDPLIKGHFILPFSTAGFVAHLKTQGIRFPDFIDYSYDSESNDDRRYCMYENEVTRLLRISIKDWHRLWYDNLDVLAHNQNFFANRPLQQIDLEQIVASHGKL